MSLQRYKVYQQNFLSFWGSLFAILPSDNPEKEIVEKMKKIPGDIIILHMCTKSDNHYDSGS